MASHQGNKPNKQTLKATCFPIGETAIAVLSKSQRSSSPA